MSAPAHAISAVAGPPSRPGLRRAGRCLCSVSRGLLRPRSAHGKGARLACRSPGLSLDGWCVDAPLSARAAHVHAHARLTLRLNGNTQATRARAGPAMGPVTFLAGMPQSPHSQSQSRNKPVNVCMRVYPSCACTFPSAVARERARTCVRMRVFSHAGGLARRKPRFCNGCIPRLSPAPPGNQTPLIYTHKFTEYPSVYPKPRPTHLLVDRFRLHFPHACIPCAHTTLVPACSTAHTPSTHPSCIHAGVCVRERKRRTHTHTRARTHTHAHTHAHTHIHTHAHPYTHTHTQRHTYTHTHTHTHTHTSGERGPRLLTNPCIKVLARILSLLLFLPLSLLLSLLLRA